MLFSLRISESVFFLNETFYIFHKFNEKGTYREERRYVYKFDVIPGCSIRVETLGNFEGKSRLPRQNSGTLEKIPREKFWAIFKHMLKDILKDFFCQ